MQRVSPAMRDALMSGFRERICERMEIAPLLHQRRWWCATDGRVLDEGTADPAGVTVKLPSGEVVRMGTQPRAGGPARVIADLAAFKAGKSFSAALWLSGLAAVPGGEASLVGIEYDTVSPEFNYICEFLLSERGMNLTYDTLQNRPRDGKMWLELPNGVKVVAKSWERKDTLKGKEQDVYLFAEAYQLPGLECYSSIKQNLVARDGYAVFPTTPDRPWLKELHDHGHGDPDFPQWECVCGVPRSQNVYTYNAREEREDRTLLTKEKFAIAHYGQMGDFVGRVFNYARGTKPFTAASHPELFVDGITDRAHLRVPPGWTVVAGADTGTFYSALLMAFSPDGHAFILEECPNYRYVGGEPDRDESLSVPQWARTVATRLLALGGRASLWADANSQFKQELRNYGITLLADHSTREQRTEVTREYFEHGRVWLAPWLTVLPFEIENAAWPAEASASGKFERVKDRDHTLDCLEHILVKRPFGRTLVKPKTGSWAGGQGLKARRGLGSNIHLGVN